MSSRIVSSRVVSSLHCHLICLRPSRCILVFISGSLALAGCGVDDWDGMATGATQGEKWGGKCKGGSRAPAGSISRRTWRPCTPRGSWQETHGPAVALPVVRRMSQRRHPDKVPLLRSTATETEAWEPTKAAGSCRYRNHSRALGTSSATQDASSTSTAARGKAGRDRFKGSRFGSCSLQPPLSRPQSRCKKTSKTVRWPAGQGLGWMAVQSTYSQQSVGRRRLQRQSKQPTRPWPLRAPIRWYWTQNSQKARHTRKVCALACPPQETHSR